MQAILPTLQARGFTVEFRQLPGAHEYTYWSAGLKDALPWAAQKLRSRLTLTSSGLIGTGESTPVRRR